MADEPLVIDDQITIPPGELDWRFDPSGGPGGQHANKASTRAEVRFDLGESPSIPEDLRDRMLARLGTRAPGGVVIVAVDESRSQWRNRVTARRRLVDLLEDALRPPPRRRRRTKPSRSARRRRLEAKRRRGETKRLRRRPKWE